MENLNNYPSILTTLEGRLIYFGKENARVTIIALGIKTIVGAWDIQKYLQEVFKRKLIKEAFFITEPPIKNNSLSIIFQVFIDKGEEDLDPETFLSKINPLFIEAMEMNEKPELFGSDR